MTETEKFEPHLQLTVGSYTDLWHRFKKPQRHPKFGVFLTTRCDKEIYDHYNVRSVYNIRVDRFCGRCFPNGVTSEGRAKPSVRDAGEFATTTNAPSDAAPPAGELGNTKGSVPLTSDSEPIVSESDDARDGRVAPSESRGVLGNRNEGHLEELQAVGELGDPDSTGSTKPQGGQGQSIREPGKGSTKPTATGRDAKKGTT